MSSEAVKKAVQQCHNAFLQWKKKSTEDRAKIIKAIGQNLQEHKDELAALMTQEMGKLVKQGHQEVDLCTGICNYTAEHGPDRLADEERELSQGVGAASSPIRP
jgi:succinate-semialdehyde dehydrogenase/glutarate-semialdehyde dehydrogenase